MSYYLEPNSHVSVILQLSNNAAKKELEHDAGVDTSDLDGRKNLAARVKRANLVIKNNFDNRKIASNKTKCLEVKTKQKKKKKKRKKNYK